MKCIREFICKFFTLSIVKCTSGCFLVLWVTVEIASLWARGISIPSLPYLEPFYVKMRFNPIDIEINIYGVLWLGVHAFIGACGLLLITSGLRSKKKGCCGGSCGKP